MRQIWSIGIVGGALLMGPLVAACASAVSGEEPGCVPGLGKVLHAQGGPKGSTGTNGISLDEVKREALAKGSIAPRALAKNGPEGDATRPGGLVLGRGVPAWTTRGGASITELRLEGGVLQGVDARGGAHTGDELEGLVIPALSNGREIQLVVAASAAVTGQPDMLAYRLTYDGENVCDGDDHGVFVSGYWDERGAHHEAYETNGARFDLSFSCERGVIAKCMRWGYKPWTVGPEAHQTCTRLTRADYCGDGLARTLEGTPIDVFDVAGVQTPVSPAGFSFEAGWNANGAVCVNRARYDARDAAGRVATPSCWDQLPRCDSWVKAQSLGATHGNSSELRAANACE